MSITPYPEHVKLQLIQKESQVCGEFLEWLENEKGFCFSIRNSDDGSFSWNRTPIDKLLSEFFGVNLAKLEAEKKQMLAELKELKG